MVLDRFAHHAELLLREPAAELPVLEEDPTGVDVVALPSERQSRVVIGRDGVDHLGTDVVVAGQGQAARDDRADMLRAVCAVESLVAGDDRPFDVLFEFPVHAAKVRKIPPFSKGGIFSSGVGRPVYAPCVTWRRIRRAFRGSR